LVKREQLQPPICWTETRRSFPNNQQQTNVGKYQSPLNGIALSGFALILGIGLFLFLPWIGLVLVCIGIIGLVLSFIFNALPKRWSAHRMSKALSRP